MQAEPSAVVNGKMNGLNCPPYDKCARPCYMSRQGGATA